MVCPGDSEVKASACNVGDLVSIPGSGRSPGEGNGNPLQYFGHFMRRVDSLEKNSDAGRDWGREEKGTTEDEMAGRHHRLE